MSMWSWSAAGLVMLDDDSDNFAGARDSVRPAGVGTVERVVMPGRN